MTRRHVRQQLPAQQTHVKNQGNGDHIDRRAQERAALGGLLVLGGKGPLPHLRPRQREHKVGDNVAEDLAVEGGLDIGRIKMGQESREAPRRRGRADGDENVHKNQEHEELHNIGIDHAEQAGGRRIDDEDHRGDQRRQLI